MQNLSLPQNFERELLRRPFNTLGIGMGALWYAIGVNFGILKSHSKFFAPQNFEKDSPRGPYSTFGGGMGALFAM